MSKVLWFHRHVQVFPIKFAKFRFRSKVAICSFLVLREGEGKGKKPGMQLKRQRFFQTLISSNHKKRTSSYPFFLFFQILVLAKESLLLFCYLSISLVGSSQEMLTSLLAFEIIENSFSCRKIASYPVYKLSVVIQSQLLEKKTKRTTTTKLFSVFTLTYRCNTFSSYLFVTVINAIALSKLYSSLVWSNASSKTLSVRSSQLGLLLEPKKLNT